LCRSNVELGDWIIEQLCAFSKREVHAKLVAQIIMENPDSQESRINRLLKFILTNLEQEDIKNVVYLTLLIDSFLITLLNSAKNYQTQLVQEIPIEVAP
jgi:spore germination protein GerM